MGTTSIEWTEVTWNPVRGCSRVSPGCDNCYAMRQAHRSSGPGGAYEGLTTIRKGKVDWAGMARLVPEQLEAPLRRRKPTTYFVNSMSDLFHDSLAKEEIAAVFAVMAACSHHTFQVLTKRAKRMLEVVTELYASDASLLYDAAEELAGRMGWCHVGEDDWKLPLPNVWLGVSAENQEQADKRIPLLLKCHAAIRWVSAEPLLGPLDPEAYLRDSRIIHMSMSIEGALANVDALDSVTDTDGNPMPRAEVREALETLRAAGARVIPAGDCDNFDDQKGCLGHVNPHVDWVVVGGESGNGARPFELSWAHEIVTACQQADVACFVKQLGRRPEHAPDGSGRRYHLHLNSRKGGDPNEWPEDLRVREFPEVRP